VVQHQRVVVEQALPEDQGQALLQRGNGGERGGQVVLDDRSGPAQAPDGGGPAAEALGAHQDEHAAAFGGL